MSVQYIIRGPIIPSLGIFLVGYLCLRSKCNVADIRPLLKQLSGNIADGGFYIAWICVPARRCHWVDAFKRYTSAVMPFGPPRLLIRSYLRAYSYNTIGAKRSA